MTRRRLNGTCRVACLLSVWALAGCMPPPPEQVVVRGHCEETAAGIVCRWPESEAGA